jgi:parallel beta-helix repeat protein
MASYYVDATLGNDAADGRSEATAWQTLPKVRGSTFSLGESVLFKRGERFPGYLEPHNGGTAGAYITYGAYGTGPKPIIDGGNTSEALWHPAKSYVAYEGLRFQLDYGYLKSNMIFFGACVGVRIINCEVYAGSSGIMWGGAADVSDSLISGCEISYSLNDAVLIQSPRNTIENCVLHHCCETNDDRSAISINSEDAINCVVRGNTIYDCDNFTNLRGIIVDFVGSAGPTLVERNRVYGCPKAIQVFNADNVTVRNNLCYNSSHPDSGDGFGIDVRNADNNLIYHNTVHKAGYGIYLYNANNNIVKNNIMSDCVGLRNMTVYGGGEATNVIDHNQYFRTGGGNQWYWIDTAYDTIAAWRTASGQDAASQDANPGMTDPDNGDLTLQATSPCRDTGENVGVTDDYEGNPRPFSGSYLKVPDIGAYEYTRQTAFRHRLSAVSEAGLDITLVLQHNSPEPARGVLQGAVMWSYSGDPTTGRLTIMGGGFGLDYDIIVGGPDFVPFYAPIKAANSFPILITLHAGGAGIIGKLNLVFAYQGLIF